MKKLTKEIKSFQNNWKGGFRSGYDHIRNQKGLEKYLSTIIKGKRVLEIGCGGGQWSKFMYDYVDKLYCVDILSAEHNNFWEFIGKDKKDKVDYLHVDDFSLSDIPPNSIDFVFSYDVFCHISLSGVEAYLKNIYPKCTDEALLLIMYADVDKNFKITPANIKRQANVLRLRNNFEWGGDLDKLKKKLIEECDGEPYVTGDGKLKSRWYWIGITNFVNLCEKHGYKILNKDLDIDKRDPLTLFTKK